MPGLKKVVSSFLLLILILTSCTSGTEEPPDPTEPNVQATPTSSMIETPVPTDAVEYLTIWLPTFLSPFQETPEGILLAERLAAYEELNPDLSIQIRIKDEEGPAGLLESLSAASSAAPSALPDLIALDPFSLYSAATRGLIIPLNDIYETPALPTWYQHGIDSVYIGDSHFGIPFASSADVFAFREEAFENPPLGWADLLAGTETFLFPGGDKNAAFTLAQYLSLDGPTEDDEGQVSLNTNTLREVLEFYLTSKENGLLPLSSLQYITSNQTWTVLQQVGVSSAVMPLDTFLEQASEGIFTAQPLPTSDGEGIVLTKTYSWSLVTDEPTQQALATDLIDWLITPEFLGAWAHRLGMLPATSAALSHWPSEETTATVNQLIRVAQPFPNKEIVTIIGPALQNSIEEVLFNRSTANAAALMAAEQVRNP